MSDENRTPGPWEVAKRGTYPDDEGYKVLGPGQINSRGKPYRLYVAQYVKNEADARFISAAPELFAALGCLYDLICDLPQGDLSNVIHAALADARDALAKAGRE